MEPDPLHQSIEVVEIVKLDLKRSLLAVFGTDANTRPEVLAVRVDGINIAIRHTRQSQTSQGGRVAKAMPIDLSNLALLDKNGKATRVGFRMEGDQKVRFAKTTGDVI